MPASTTIEQHASRNIALDTIKGICIILMVIGHSGVPIAFERLISSFHMPAFFIVSGFLFKDAYLNDISRFIRKRFKSIWWVYVFWTIVFIFLHNPMANIGIYEQSYTSIEIFKRIGKGIAMYSTEQLLGGFWFLTALLFSSLTSIIFFRIFGLSIKSLITGIFVTLTISWFMVSQIVPDFLYFNSKNMLSTSFFITGVLFAKSNLHLIASKKIVLLSALLSITVATFWIRGSILTVKSSTLFPYYFTASIISLGLFVVFWRYPQANSLRYLSKIGSRTLDILIFHFLALKLVSFCRIHFGHMDISCLSDFPVVNFKEVKMNPIDLNWILYTVGALFITLCFSEAKNYLNKGLSKLSPFIPKIP